jgi:hypothetical protein
VKIRPSNPFLVSCSFRLQAELRGSGIPPKGGSYRETKQRLVIAALLIAVAVPGQVAAADQVIFVVRHAERADAGSGPPPGAMMANDPSLSAAGHERAARLAALLATAVV